MVLRPRPGRHPDVVDLTDGQAGQTTTDPPVMQQVSERHVMAHVTAADPDGPAAAALIISTSTVTVTIGIGVTTCRDLLERDVGIDEPVHRDRLGHDREPLRVDTEMSGESSQQLLPSGTGTGQLPRHPLDKVPERHHEGPDLLAVVPVVGHGSNVGEPGSQGAPGGELGGIRPLLRRGGSLGPVLLSDKDIRAEIDLGRVVLDPWDPAMVQPSSVDVRLDKYFRLFDNHRYPYIDPAADQPDLTRLVEVDHSEDGLVLHPGEFVLGSSLEMVTLPDDLAARVEGKSSLGRLGLLTHATAGFVDPGFSGHVTLELSNVATLPIMLYPGMKIGQLCFFRLSSPAESPYGSGVYGSHYQGQRGPTASRSHKNFHRTRL